MSRLQLDNDFPPGQTVGMATCVFGGARPGADPRCAELAGQLGDLLAVRGHRLVYGAGGTGIMGAVADAMAAGGAHVTGVIPRFLYQLERGEDSPCHRLVVTDDLFDRKRYMVEEADAFIALPGGYGTVDEIVEVISLAYLGCITKPIALIDIGGLWDGLVSLLAELGGRGFAGATPTALFEVFTSAAQAVDFIESAAAASTPALPRSNSVVGV